ncbi:MAG: integrase, partial [Muribaculaceae bacterium]
MKRKKYMLDHIKSLRDKKKKAAEISEVVLRKLRSGWNPWIDNNDSRSYTIFDDAIDRYLAL